MYISFYQVFKYKFCHKNNMSCSSIHTENTLIKSFSPFSAPGEAGAGLWGTVDACDVPFSLVDSLFKHLSSIQDQVSTKPYCQNQVCTEPNCQDRSQMFLYLKACPALFLVLFSILKCKSLLVRKGFSTMMLLNIV